MMKLTGILFLIAFTFSDAEEPCASRECSSWLFAYATCPVYGLGIITNITVGGKYSAAACEYGTSYGIGNDQRSIWVSEGCRARFTLCYQPDALCSAVECQSWVYAFSSCRVENARVVTSVRISNTYTPSLCEYGHGFGSDANSVWVNHGCRAKFIVCYLT